MPHKFLVDETPFVRVFGRTDNTVINNLKNFLHDARGEGIELYMPYISAQRLGIGAFHRWRCKRRSEKTLRYYTQQIRDAYGIRYIRSNYASKVIQGRKKRSLLQRISHNDLYSLFVHANEMKSSMDEIELGDGRMRPHEVIPLENCIVAQIARRTGLPLLSFNRDYKYFSNYRNDPSYIDFKLFDDFLLQEYPRL